MARPPKPIDWNLVEEKMAAGCSGIEIAQDFRICKDTFYDRFIQEYGESFSDYSARQACVGEGNIKFIQYAKAIGRTKGGDTALLMFLGKVRLKQREHEEIVTSPQDSNLNFADAYIKAEHERAHMAKELQALREELNALKPKTDPVIQRSDEEIQHMGGSSQIGQDLFEHPEAN